MCVRVREREGEREGEESVTLRKIVSEGAEGEVR